MKKILVVDDSQFAAHTMQRLFNGKYIIHHAQSGKDAIEYLKKEKPDLILMDVLMPGISGVDAFQCLRDDPKTRDIPVIFVTAIADGAIEAQCLELGAKDFIKKPIHAKVLSSRIKNALGQP